MTMVQTFRPEEKSFQEFLNKEKISKKDFKYLSPSGWFNYKGFVLALKNDDEVVAITELKINPHESKFLGLSHLSVKPKEQGKGYSSKLMEEVFDLCEREKQPLKMSSYTHQGFWTIRKKALKLEKQGPVELFEQGLFSAPMTKAEDLYKESIFLRENGVEVDTKDLSIYKNKELSFDVKNNFFKKIDLLPEFQMEYDKMKLDISF